MNPLTARTRTSLAAAAGAAALVVSLTACTQDVPATNTTASPSSSIAAPQTDPPATQTTQTNPGLPTTPTTEPGPEGPSSPAASGGSMSLDGSDRPTGEVMWGMKTNIPGWQIKVFDQSGYNQSVATNGCQVTTFQGKGNLSTYPTDEAVSIAKAQDFENAMKKEAIDAQVAGHSKASFTRGVAGKAGGDVEFVVTRVNYTRKDNGEKWTTFFAARGFAKEGVLLTANLSCKTEEFDKDKDLLKSMVELVSVQA